MVMAGLLAGLSTLSAATVALKPTADTRTSGTTVLASNTADLGVGTITATNFTRTYLTFDLTALTAADAAVVVKLALFNAGSEANTSTVAHVYTLFQVAENWNNTPTPGPEGTALATINITPSSGTDTKNIEFSSPELVTAFNNAIGSVLYLGIKSNREGSPERSFTFFNSTEDVGREPTLTASTTFPPVVSVSASKANIAEPGADTVTFTLTRTRDTASELTVLYSFTGTATKNSDYIESGSGSVTLAPGVTTADVVVTVQNDDIAERLETIIFNVTANAAYDVGTPANATVTLTDDNDDGNNVLLRYIFTDPASTASTFSRVPQVYSPDVSCTDITPAAGLSGVGNSSATVVSAPNAGYVNSMDTATTAVDAIANDDYFEFTITPAFGKSLTLTELEFSAIYHIITSAGVNGTVFVRSSLDNYTTDLANTTLVRSEPFTTVNIPLGAAFSQVPTPVTFRFYVYDDTDTLQDGVRVDDIFVRGSAGPLPAGVQQVILTANDPQAAEPVGSGEFTITRAGDISAPLTVSYGVGGTAVNGTDYTLIAEQLTLAAGVSSGTVTIMPIDELVLEGTESVTLSLLSSGGYTVFPPSTATVEITDDEANALRPATGTLTLIPATTTYNRLTVTITAEGDLTATDTKTTDASGTLISVSDSDVNTGATLRFSLLTNGSTVAMTPMNFNLRAGIISAATINIANMAGTAFTDAPPGAVTPTGTGATFDAALHRLLVNKGDITGELTIPLQPSEPISDDFVSSPLTGLGLGTGTLTLTPALRTQTQQFFNAVVTLPVDFTQLDTISGASVAIRVQGTLRATGTVSALLDSAGDIATWNFNTGTTTARRAPSTVIPSATVSSLNFNASFVDGGVDVNLAVLNDGFGFGTNGGEQNLRLRRANYLDTSAVPDPRPTEQSYTSWGDGATAGTGANLTADGNAPIAFTVTAGPDAPLLISSLTVEWTSSGPLSMQFQEAGATPGPSVTLNGAQNTLYTLPLTSQVLIEAGQTKTFTINLNSDALGSSANLDAMALNGVVLQASVPDPFQTWAQANGLTAGVNDGFEANPDNDAFPNGLEWVLGGTTPNATDVTGFGTTTELLNVAADASRNLVFTFRRLDASEGEATLKVLFSNDVFVSDNHEVTIGAAGALGTPPAGVTVEITENGSAPDTITVTIPAAYSGPTQRLFGRLRATKL
jgi:hypothetical protein